MRRSWMRFTLLLVAFCLLAGSVAGAEERANIAEKYKWNLTDLYATEAAWTAAKDKMAAQIPSLDKLRGHLGDSAGSLYEGLSTLMDLQKELTRLNMYASQLYDLDTRVGHSQELVQAATKVAVDFGAAASFVRPEILSLDPVKVRGFIAADARLKPYEMFLDDILRWKPHTLTSAEEKIAAQTGEMAGSPESIYSIFTAADLPYPEVTLSTGEKVRVDQAAYTRYRAAANRQDRMNVFHAFWGRFGEFERTLGTTLSSQVKAHIFDKDIHKFDSCLGAALFDDNIPVDIYTRLIADVHENLPTLHRYLKLRQRMMKVDKLGYEDLYASVLPRVDLSYTPEQAVDMTLAAVAPLGPEYATTLRNGLATGHWVDFLPSTGKRSGAYSTKAYDVHPFQLLNFVGGYDDVSTLAHESGHSMHSWLSDKTQPYPTHDYSIFVAEVASTLNESLLLAKTLREVKDNDTRLFLLGSRLDNMRTTLFRQTLFAEFEMKIHEMAEKGEPLTGENLSALYLKLLREYYGHDLGVCNVDEMYQIEWAYIHHFYYNFYVFQYATSMVASSSISNAILEQAALKKPVTTARDAYLKMLSSGSSKYPVELLKDGGVDMTTSAPFKAAMKEMNTVMDQMEKILNTDPKYR